MKAEEAAVGARVAVLSGLLFFSGIGALIFETLWLRLSGLAFGNSVWAAALILSSFMAGLALGNAIGASSTIRRWRPLHLYAVLEILVAILGCTIVFGLPLLGAWLRPLWQMLWNFQPTLLALRFVMSFMVLLIPTTAMGLTLPVLIEDPILRGSDLVSVSAFVCGFIFPFLCDHARGRADGHRFRRGSLECHLPQRNTTKQFSGDTVVVRGRCGARLLPALSGRGGKNSDRFFSH